MELSGSFDKNNKYLLFTKVNNFIFYVHDELPEIYYTSIKTMPQTDPDKMLISLAKI